MRILYVHECFGALAGAETNAHITATALGRRGHEVAILHGPATGRDEDAWYTAFRARFPLQSEAAEAVHHAITSFRPDTVYIHEMAEVAVIEALVASNVPLVRIVHDHDTPSVRSIRDDYLTRRIGALAAGPACIFPCLELVSEGFDFDGYISELEALFAEVSGEEAPSLDFEPTADLIAI